jgi:hypothetical protein
MMAAESVKWSKSVSKKANKEETGSKLEFAGKVAGLRASSQIFVFDLSTKKVGERMTLSLGYSPASWMVAMIVGAEASGRKLHVSLESGNGHAGEHPVVSSIRIGAKPKLVGNKGQLANKIGQEKAASPAEMPA